MTKNAFHALWATVFLSFVIACGKPHAEPTSASSNAQSHAREDAEAGAAAAALQKAAIEKEEAATHTRSHEQAMRVAAEIVTTAALFDLGATFPACESHVFSPDKWSDTDPAFAEFGLGLPIQQWECAGDVTLDDAKRSLAALLARHSVDVIVSGTRETDALTAKDRPAVICEIAQITDRATGYQTCLDRIAANAQPMAQMIVNDDAQRCADTIVTANIGAIDTIARQLEGPISFTTGGDVHPLRDTKAISAALSAAGIVPMRGELAKGLPSFCSAPTARKKPRSEQDDADLATSPEKNVVRALFVRVAASLTTYSLLQRNPASGCDAWTNGAEAHVQLISLDESSDASTSNRSAGIRYDGSTACRIINEYASASADTAAFGNGKPFYSTTDMADMWTFQDWANRLMHDDSNWSTRQKVLWNDRWSTYANVHFPAYKKYREQAAWKYGVCGREIAKANQALISDTADALQARFIMTASVTELGEGATAHTSRELHLPIADALALMPHKAVFPGKMKVPAFCAAPEPAKAKMARTLTSTAQ